MTGSPEDRRALRAHEDWIGLAQPTGLVVSPAALLTAGAFVSKDVLLQQQALQRLVDASRAQAGDAGAVAFVDDVRAFLSAVLDWADGDLVDDPAQLAAVSVPLHEYGETLRVTYLVKAPPGADGIEPQKPLLLVKVLPLGTDFDDAKVFEERQWKASAQDRFERILRESDVPIGILWNGQALRLTYLPKGEISGHVTFPIAALLEVANRSMLSALRLLLSAERLFTLPEKQRLPALLANSRKVQNQVSTELAEQFLVALAELLRGFQAADVASKQQLLHDFRAGRGFGDVYGGLLSVLLRLVFVLYAEDRGLLPDDEVFREGYSVRRLYERLRDDADAHPDTMDQRYGAWGQLLALFRLIYGGAQWPQSGSAVAAPVRLPAREGRLFDPESYPFLEGRTASQRVQQGERITPPRVSDGVVLRVLESLLLLDGAKLSYRTLDVEQIGSVYEGLMGFTIDVAEGASVAVLPHHVVVNVETVLQKKPAERAAVFDDVKCKLTAKQQAELKAAANVDDVVRALGNKVSRRMPLLVAGSLYLQPTDERRRSGSHYTPRALTDPIVRTALRPILERLDEDSRKTGKVGITPEQILDLKLCDPAMGSGAFLVQAGRQLGAHLVEAWARTNSTPKNIPPDETPLLHATRLVATRCLYGVDKNPLAVELAKLSLWLDTLAKDHPFTFLDHSLREGDSLVGLTVRNLRCFSWKPDADLMFTSAKIDTALARAQAIREELEKMGDSGDDGQKRAMHKRAEAALADLRLIGDAAIAAFFSPNREETRVRYLALVRSMLERGDREILQSTVDEVLCGEHQLKPFHWEIDFPEVFGRPNNGFDAIVGNPPYAGNLTLVEASSDVYTAFLRVLFPPAKGRTDLVAYFFRRAFSCIRDQGAFGFLATKTVAQGDTRRSGLSVICSSGGVIFNARRRVQWVGTASVVPSIVCVFRGAMVGPFQLDGNPVAAISPFLFAAAAGEPFVLSANEDRCFLGCKPGRSGFVVEPEEVSSIAGSVEQGSLAEYGGGAELLDNPNGESARKVFALGLFKAADELARFPRALSVLAKRLGFDALEAIDVEQDPKGSPAKNAWWKFAHAATTLSSKRASMERSLFRAEVSSTFAFMFKDISSFIPSNKIVAVCLAGDEDFCLLQSRIHEEWARLTSSTMKDDLSYGPRSSFETFPFPDKRKRNSMADVGYRYTEYRTGIMHLNDEGLTKTYHRFHDPDHDGTGISGRDPRDVVKDIETLRTLHDEMDRAVLDAYGWTDIRPTCEFLLDYEEDDDDDDDEGSKKRKKKKPWRYRWPDDVRDEVLARLLELNKKYAEEERAEAERATQTQLNKDVAFALTAPMATTPKKKASKKATKKEP